MENNKPCSIGVLMFYSYDDEMDSSSSHVISHSTFDCMTMRLVYPGKLEDAPKKNVDRFLQPSEYGKPEESMKKFNHRRCVILEIDLSMASKNYHGNAVSNVVWVPVSSYRICRSNLSDPDFDDFYQFLNSLTYIPFDEDLLCMVTGMLFEPSSFNQKSDSKAYLDDEEYSDDDFDDDDFFESEETKRKEQQEEWERMQEEEEERRREQEYYDELERQRQQKEWDDMIAEEEEMENRRQFEESQRAIDEYYEMLREQDEERERIRAEDEERRQQEEWERERAEEEERQRQQEEWDRMMEEEERANQQWQEYQRAIAEHNQI